MKTEISGAFRDSQTLDISELSVGKHLKYYIYSKK